MADYHATDCAMIDGQGICTCGLQPSLFDDLDPGTQADLEDMKQPHQLARADGPDTSKAAAAMKRGSQRWRMLVAFHNLYPRPATWDQAAKEAGIQVQSSPWSRCTDLAQLGLIMVEGIGRTATGAKAHAYLITDAGFKQLQQVR